MFAGITGIFTGAGVDVSADVGVGAAMKMGASLIVGGPATVSGAAIAGGIWLLYHDLKKNKKILSKMLSNFEKTN